MLIKWSDTTTIAALINSTVTAIAFWFAAVRLRGPWFLYGLAAVKTVQTVLIAGMLSGVVFESAWIDFDIPYQLHAIEQLLEVVLVIPIAIWLVRRFNTSRQV